MSNLSLEEKELILREIHESNNLIDWSLDEINEIEGNPKHIMRPLRDNKGTLVGIYVLKRISSNSVDISLVLVLKAFRDWDMAGSC